MVNYSYKGKRGTGGRPLTIVKGCVIIAVCFVLLKALQDQNKNDYIPFHSLSSSVSDYTSSTTATVADPNRAQTWDPYASFVPVGQAVALPSIPASADEEAKLDRHIYGGKGDKAHLGGFTAFDKDGVAIYLWKHMIQNMGIKSILDLGCGKGTSTSWFILHGLEYVVCAEGSHDAVTNSLLPKIPKDDIPADTKWEIVEHDFSRGPWWPSQTVVSRLLNLVGCVRQPQASVLLVFFAALKYCSLTSNRSIIHSLFRMRFGVLNLLSMLVVTSSQTTLLHGARLL